MLSHRLGCCRRHDGNNLLYQLFFLPHAFYVAARYPEKANSGP